MFNYTSQKQIEIFDFKTEFLSKLDSNNRWVRMAKLLDWDALASIYGVNFSSTMGAKAIEARVVIGALIIKHIESKDDRGTIDMIAENPYMQYFLGFDHFSSEPIFDPSLFVYIRKRLGNEDFDKMNQILIAKALNLNEIKDKKIDENEPEKPLNKGKLQMDATIADANIKYPTDLSLLNDSREKSEQIIDQFCSALKIEKPRTYRQNARKAWLNLSKSKKKTRKQIHNGIKQQLNYLKRNLKSIDTIIDNNPLIINELDKKQYKYLLVIKELYRQQLEMFVEKKNSVQNRIVSIHQPHVRPMVRGKQGKNVEFGAKINVSLQNGYARIDQVDFEALNEGVFLKEQVENYKKLNGYYPEVVQTDDFYMTRENRNYLKINNIRHTGKPLGRKSKAALSKIEAQKLKTERNERNHIEGKFGQGKTKYKLNNIMAKLENTSKSWIATIIFVMNIIKLNKDFLFSFLKETFLMYIFKILYFNKNKKIILLGS